MIPQISWPGQLTSLTIVFFLSKESKFSFAWRNHFSVKTGKKLLSTMIVFKGIVYRATNKLQKQNRKFRNSIFKIKLEATKGINPSTNLN